MAKYSKKTQEHVENTMHRKKKGTLKSGSGQKVKSSKQAIAIALSEAREKGYKAPEKSAAKKTGVKKTAKKSPKKGATSKKTAKKPVAKKAVKRSAAKRTSVRKKGAARKK